MNMSQRYLKSREARPPPKAAGAGGAPELREGRQAKLGCDSTATTQLPRISCLGRRESVPGTYGISKSVAISADLLSVCLDSPSWRVYPP